MHIRHAATSCEAVYFELFNGHCDQGLRLHLEPCWVTLVEVAPLRLVLAIAIGFQRTSFPLRLVVARELAALSQLRARPLHLLPRSANVVLCQTCHTLTLPCCAICGLWAQLSASTSTIEYGAGNKTLPSRTGTLCCKTYT